MSCLRDWLPKRPAAWPPLDAGEPWALHASTDAQRTTQAMICAPAEPLDGAARDLVACDAGERARSGARPAAACAQCFGARISQHTRPSRTAAESRSSAITQACGRSATGHHGRPSRVAHQQGGSSGPASVASSGSSTRASGTHGSPRPSTAHDTSKEQRRAVPRQARGARIRRRRRPQGRVVSGRGVPGHEPLGRLLGARGPGCWARVQERLVAHRAGGPGAAAGPWAKAMSRRRRVRWAEMGAVGRERRKERMKI